MTWDEESAPRQEDHGHWDTPGLPHKGWEDHGTCDVREEQGRDRDDYATCEMCGQTGIRFIHLMKHSARDELLCVGEVCAEKMVLGYAIRGRKRTT